MVIENGILEYIEKGEYAPKTNLEYVERENVALVVKYLDNYLFLSWNKVAYQKSLVTGGIECGETKEEAARREVIEETGYYDIETIIPLDGINVSKFYVEHKNQNREAKYYPYLVILKSLNRKSIAYEESVEHTCIWCKEDEIDSIDLFDNHRYMLNKGLKYKNQENNASY